MLFKNLLWPLLSALALTTITPSLHAQDKELKEQLEQLAFVRQIRYTGEWPTLTGFSPAKPVNGFEAAPGDHGHTQAYRSAAGCVAFFFPPGDEGGTEVALKWKGHACNGKLVEGKGELQIWRRVGEQTVVGVLEGHFSKGVLAGEGEKSNFTFDKAGKPVPDVYSFEGTFANSVLHGQGAKRWSGAANARPSAWVQQGKFQDGTIRGGVMLYQLRPYPGVEAQVQPLWFSERGNTYIEQAQVNRGKLLEGTLFFEGDPVPWKSEVAVWRDGLPEAARLTRMDMARRHMMIASCLQWRFEGARLACDRGSASAGGEGGSIGTDEGAFGIRLPVPARVVTFQPEATTALTLGLDNAQIPARCDAELARCTGRGVLPVRGSLLYWHGDIEWRDGALRPTSASLYERPWVQRSISTVANDGTVTRTGSDADDAKAEQIEEALRKTPYDPGNRDRRVASCERFDSPLECSRGKLFGKDGGSFVGAWRYDGVTYSSDGPAAPRYTVQGNQRMVRRGWGTTTFSNGRWAEAHYDSDGDIDDVGKCDDPDSSDNFRCKLDGATVMFYNESSSNSSSSQSRPQREVAAPVYTAPSYSSGGGRYVPQVVPQRPVYVLPGMR